MHARLAYERYSARRAYNQRSAVSRFPLERTLAYERYSAGRVYYQRSVVSCFPLECSTDKLSRLCRYPLEGSSKHAISHSHRGMYAASIGPYILEHIYTRNVFNT
jgi:hypothetical protein